MLFLSQLRFYSAVTAATKLKLTHDLIADQQDLELTLLDTFMTISWYLLASEPDAQNYGNLFSWHATNLDDDWHFSLWPTCGFLCCRIRLEPSSVFHSLTDRNGALRSNLWGL